MQGFLLVSLGGVLGANVRYVVSAWAADRLGSAFPYGTLLVNVAGSFLIGLVLGVLATRFGDDPTLRLTIATGFLGAETTFSTFGYETIALVRLNAYAAAVRNVASNLLLGLTATAAGLVIAAVLTGTAQW